jgi:hypothetical protein
MRVFLLRVRYGGALLIVFIGAVLAMPGEWLMRLGRWIGSRDK